MRSVHAVLIAILLLSSAVSARDLPEGLTTADVPEGVLLDPGPRLSGLHRHDGGPGSPRVTTGLWRQMLFELRRAATAHDAWPDARALERRALKTAAPAEVPVAILDASYARLPAATTTGAPVDPRALERGRVFAAAPLRAAAHHGALTTFVFDASWCVGDRPASLEIDAGDGLGWRPVRDDRAVARYRHRGEALVGLRTVAEDGATRTTRFVLDIAALDVPAPHDTLHVQASTPWDGAYASGDAYVYLADGHATITNPVIVVEGFDLDDTMAWDELYTLLNQEDLVETLRADGYDAVVLDFDSATEPIQRNAFVLTELIAQVRADLPPTRTLAVVGASMGGLVSRYALAWLEGQGVDAGVRLWVSFDSPQRGACIPLGLQHWLEFFQDESESAAFLLSRLDTPAARQMLLHHHDATTGTVAAADPLRAAFVQDLTAVGYPSCRRVAVANGSGVAADQGFAPGAQLVRYEYRSLLLDLTGNVWALSDGPTIRIFEGEQNLIWPLPDVYEDVLVGGTAAWDGAPGGRRASMAQMDTTSVPYGDIEALHDHHCFIPTISALDLDVADPFHDVLQDSTLMSFTSFDALHVPAENEDHVTLTPTSAAWLLDEIRAGTTAVEEGPPADATALRAWPNPFNPAVTVLFALPTEVDVVLSAHDLRGRRLATLVRERLPAGDHVAMWRARGDDGVRLGAGVYLLRLETADATAVRRITLLE